MRPVFAVYSTFLQRSYDQLIHDAAIGELHLVLAVDRAGIVGDDGETHQGVFDVSMLNTIPNTVIFFTVIFRGYEKSSQPSNLCLQGSCRYTLPARRRIVQAAGFRPESIDFNIYGNTECDKLIITYGRLFSYACKAKGTAWKRGYRSLYP